MRRLLLAVLLGCLVLAGCGASNTAPPLAPGVPALTGDPTDLTAPTQAGPGVGDAPADLVTSDVVVGTGAPATPADTVAVRYTGTTWADGQLFDSSWSNGDEPISFPLSGVIPGFAQGIEGMAPGGRRVLVMPADLAYGDNPSGGAPGGPLVFVVDLVSIE